MERKFIPLVAAGGVLLVADQHAAHERVRLEHLTALLAEAVAANRQQQQQQQEDQQGGLAPRLGNGGSSGGGLQGQELTAASAAASALGAGTGQAAAAALGCAVQPGPLEVQLVGAELLALRAHARHVDAWGWRLQQQQQQLTDAATQATGASCFMGVAERALLTHVPLVFGVPLSATDLKVRIGRPAAAGGGGELAVLPSSGWRRWLCRITHPACGFRAGPWAPRSPGPLSHPRPPTRGCALQPP